MYTQVISNVMFWYTYPNIYYVVLLYRVFIKENTLGEVRGLYNCEVSVCDLVGADML